MRLCLRLTHDLEHPGTALGALAFHGQTSICHRYFSCLLHVALSLALYAIRFNFCCHFIQGFSSKPKGKDC